MWYDGVLSHFLPHDQRIHGLHFLAYCLASYEVVVFRGMLSMTKCQRQVCESSDFREIKNDGIIKLKLVFMFYFCTGNCHVYVDSFDGLGEIILCAARCFKIAVWNDVAS
jgi:hypothetical protein